MRLKNQYFLLRHGETVWKKTGLSYPWPDSPKVCLNRNGRKQIKEAAGFLNNKKIGLIFSSDFFRARQSARIVAKALRRKIVFDKRLRDTYIGYYHGKPKSVFNHDFPLSKLGARFKKRPKEGENWDEVKKRVKEFLLGAEKQYQGKRILIVSHGDPLWLLEGLIRDLSDKELVDIILGKKYIKTGELKRL